MAKKFSTKLKEGNWVDWEDGAKLLLRPFPMSQSVMDISKLDMAFTLTTFKYCVVDWKGIVDDSDKPIPCNDKMKEYLFDYYPDLVNFAMTSVTEKITVGDKESKN